MKVVSLTTIFIAAVSNAENFNIDQAELRAQLSPARYAVLSAEMAGKIDSLPVLEGQSVAEGDLLISFDCSLQAAQLQKVQTQLSVARNNLQGSERMAELNAIGSVELANAQLEAQSAKADIAYLEATMERCEIRAPYTGSIGDLTARSQEFVQAGQPLVEILDDSKLQLEFIAPSRWLSWMTPGYGFDVFIEDTGKQYPAVLERVAAKVDAMSQSVKAVAVIEGNFPELLPGMSGRIRITPATSE